MIRDTKKQRQMQRFSHAQNLMPWDQVAAAWNQRSGQNITRNRVWQIAHAAEQKLRKALQEIR